MLKCDVCKCILSTEKKNIGCARRGYDDEGKIYQEFLCKKCNREEKRIVKPKESWLLIT